MNRSPMREVPLAEEAVATPWMKRCPAPRAIIDEGSRESFRRIIEERALKVRQKKPARAQHARERRGRQEGFRQAIDERR